MFRRHRLCFNLLAALSATCVALGTNGSCRAAVTIETVPIPGDGHSDNDPATGRLYGGVTHDYRMGKYDVTIGQYVEFLNSVAANDTYGLYNSSMTIDLNIAGIAWSGIPVTIPTAQLARQKNPSPT